MKVLVIGGSGHVSGAVVREVLAQGHSVWTLTRGKLPVPAGVTALIADRNDHVATKKVVLAQNMKWDLVVDCICFDVPDMQQDIQLFRERAIQFVFVSTDFVYDPAQRRFPQPEQEAVFVNPDNIAQEYGAKKRLCELELMQADMGDMAWTVFRPGHIYGPTSELGCLPQHGRDPQLIERIRANEALKLVGGGHFLQQPIFVDDLAATIISVIGNSVVNGQIYNAAGPDIIESSHYYQIIANELKVPLHIIEIPVQSFVKEHPDMTPFLCHRIYDRHKLESSGLSVPSTPIVDGLKKHVAGLLTRHKTR